MFRSNKMEDCATSAQIRSESPSFSNSVGRLSHVVALVLGLAATDAFAETLRLVTVEVTPLVADVGIPRQIKISGVWPNSCTPKSASIVPPDNSGPRSIVVRLVVSYREICLSTLMPYSLTVSYTPTHRRTTMSVAVLANESEFLGDGRIVIRAPDDNSAVADVTGVWYDPTTNGSGLTFIHNGDNVLFGTWYVYDSQGRARWYTIQNVQWKQQGKVFEGTIYETVGHNVTCPAPFLACPVEMSSVNPIGLVRFTLITPTTAKIEALTPAGQLLFSSNLVRIAI